jgi:hypothetical protein
MDLRQLYETWAPPDSVWSPWAKPALFTEPFPEVAGQAGPIETAPEGARTPSEPSAAFVVDLLGSRSVEVGLALARGGWRPVPLFNTAPHAHAVVAVGDIQSRLAAGAAELASLPITPQAPPAFLLDANRRTATAPMIPGNFDNRWIVFPQDFPSANFLLGHGVHRVVLLQPAARGSQPLPDLAHALLRWQEAGLELSRQDPDAGETRQPLQVDRPSSFRSLLYRALALAGLSRSFAGGFGARIPTPGSG